MALKKNFVLVVGAVLILLITFITRPEYLTYLLDLFGMYKKFYHREPTSDKSDRTNMKIYLEKMTQILKQRNYNIVFTAALIANQNIMSIFDTPRVLRFDCSYC